MDNSKIIKIITLKPLKFIGYGCKWDYGTIGLEELKQIPLSSLEYLF